MDPRLHVQCGCKGIRACLVCEKVEGEQPKYADENKKTVQYSHCSPCNLCWPEDVPHVDIAVRIYLGKLTLNTDYLNDEEEKDDLIESNHASSKLLKSTPEEEDLEPNVKLNKREGKSIGKKELFPFMQKLTKSLRLHKELHDSHPVELCHVDYSLNRDNNPHAEDAWIFTRSARHTTELLKDIDKFQNSIAVVVSTADNQYVRQGKRFISEDGNKFMGVIVDFLQEVKERLVEKASTKGIAAKEQKFYENAMEFIDVLLVKNIENYSETRTFTTLYKPEPLNDITLFPEHTERILHKRVNFTVEDGNNSDFIISNISKTDTNDLVEVNKHVMSSAANLGFKVQEYYHNLVKQVHNKINSFVTSKTIVDANLLEAQSFSIKLSNGYDIASNLLEDIRNLANEENLIQKIHASLNNFDIELPDGNISDLSNQGKEFKFVLSTKNMESSTMNKEWANFFQSISTYISDSKRKIQSDVYDISQKINNQIRYDINNVAKSIKAHYQQKMDKMEIQKLPAELSKGHESMSIMKEDFKNLKSINELLEKLDDNFNTLGITLASEYIQNIENKGKYFEFLQLMSNKELSSGSMEWAYPFEGVVKYLQESEQWYAFLNNLYAKFSEYEIQRDISKYNVANMGDWGIAGKPQGIVITKNIFKQFMNKIAKFNIKGHDSVKNITITDLSLKELNHVLSLTLKHKMSIECSDSGKLLIKGDFRVGINIDRAAEESCKNKSGLKSIEIFISDTLFIDKDVSLFRGAIPITVIAPKWEIIGYRKITLDGLPGKSIPNKANDGVHPGSKGEHGKPGLPGVTAGTFFGIGENFVNDVNLTISANGGEGGPGQNGGNGRKGTDGKSPPLPNEYCYYDICNGNRKLDGFRCERRSCYDGYWLILYPESSYYDGCEFRIFGTPGGPGGDGGDGGRGGIGGNPGNITLFELNNTSAVSIQKGTGKNGENGKAGTPGDKSKNGYNMLAKCYGKNWFRGRFTTQWYHTGTEYNNRDNKGKSGTDGSNERGIKTPEPAAVIHEPVNIINEYKMYLRGFLSDRFKKHSVIQFLYHLDNNKNVAKLYDTSGLVNDLKGLEEQLQKLNVDGDVDFLPFYQSLLHRISEYAKEPKHVENSNQYKKVLSYLFAATLGRMYNLQKNSEPNLVTDIYEYLNLVEKDIGTLKYLENEKYKVDMINKHTQKYKSGLDSKIVEARNFIDKQITPEIGNISTQIDIIIDSLINETLELQKLAENEMQKLVEKKKELTNKLQFRGLFSIFKMIGQITSFLGPVGAVTGTVVGSVSTITESLVLDNETNQQRISQLPGGVVSNIKTLAENIETARKEKITDLNKLLDEVSKEASKHPEKLSDTSEKVADIKKRLSKVNDKKFHFKEVQALKDELKQELKRKKVELKIPDRKSVDALKVIGKFYQVAQLGSDIYSKYKNDQSKLGILTDAIEEAENKFRNLRQYEEKIHNTIAPMLKNMGDGLTEIASKLDAKSEVALDITKWQVKDNLKEMQLQMNELTRGFKIENNLIRCIEKLKDAMITLINVYDRIESYHEQQNLANLIADVSSTVSSNIHITEPKLANAVNHLEIAIRSNIVLKQYKTTIEAFKQWVFPFSDLFLEKFMLPSHLSLEGNLQNLVSKAVKQVKTIKSKLKEYKSSVKKQDRHIHTTDFSSHCVSTKPFFVWRNENHKDMISDLLSGKEVVVKADVMNSAFDKDAIKFSFVELYFKSQNKTVQSKVNNALKGFKMSLTHTGNSYYRYGSKLHVMTSDSQTIKCSFEKKSSTGEPVDKNIVYDKIKAGNLMLSPYTVWEMRLVNSTREISFHELEIYKDEVDLELEGHGSYVDRGDILTSFMVRKRNETYEHPGVKNEHKAEATNNSATLNHHYMKSVDQVEEMGRYMTSSSSLGLSSPINYICILLKENGLALVSDILTSVNQVFLSTKDTVENSSNSNDNYRETSTIFSEIAIGTVEDGLIFASDIATEEALKPEKMDAIKADLTGHTVSSTVIGESISSLEEEELKNNKNMNKRSYTSLSSDIFNGYGNYSQLSITDEQHDNRNIQFTHVPEVNSSLLLADLITRSISGRKYKSEIEECLLSTQGMISRRINDLAAQSEHDIIHNFYELSKRENSTWFGRVKVYVKSTCQYLGFLKEENMDDYIHDIRGLFSSTVLI